MSAATVRAAGRVPWRVHPDGGHEADALALLPAGDEHATLAACSRLVAAEHFPPLRRRAQIEEEPVTVAFVAIVGLAAGVLSGLFGVGGGVIIVPALVVFLGFTAQQAAGTSLAALLLPVGLFGALQYWQAGQINVLHAALLSLGLLFGAFLGARLGLALPGESIQRAFGILLVLFGLRMIIWA